jgi:mannose-6-phosphate isomerase-like protein (cupin superfamily)
MNSSSGPVVVDSRTVDQVPVGPNGDEGTIGRVITRVGQDSSVLLGTFRLEPGQSGRFELPHRTGMQQEIYFLLAGALRVRWADQEVTVGPAQAVFFPAGETYEIESVGDTAVDLVWTGYPAPA